MAKFYETRLGLALTSAAGGALGLVILQNSVFDTEANFRDELALRVDNVIAGKPFNTEGAPEEGLRLQRLPSVNSQSLDAALYNSYENAGASNPMIPSERIRASIHCGMVVLNGAKVQREAAAAWLSAQRLYYDKDPDEAEPQYKIAADTCRTQLQNIVNGHPKEVAVPVGQE